MNHDHMHTDDSVSNDSQAPLAGIVVVSLEQAIAVPTASRQLADLGATVYKIEKPESGDFARHYDSNVGGQSAYFVWANRAKSSYVIDTKSDAGAAELEAMLAGADVYMQNLSPEAARRAGLDVDAVRARHPHLICGEVSGYGEGGPRSDDKAYDLAIQAEAGVFDVTGEGALQAKVGFSIADIAAGMYLFSGVLAALVRRGRTGAGATIKVSMLDALAEWMQAPLLNAHARGASPQRTASRHAAIAPYGTFRLSDGAQLVIAVQNNDEFSRFCDIVLGEPELCIDARFTTNSGRIQNVEALTEIILARLDSLSPSEARERLARASIATANVNSLEEVWNHPQLRARDRFVPTRLPGGVIVETLRFPADIDGCPLPPAIVPALGEKLTGHR